MDLGAQLANVIYRSAKDHGLGRMASKCHLLIGKGPEGSSSCRRPWARLLQLDTHSAAGLHTSTVHSCQSHRRDISHWLSLWHRWQNIEATPRFMLHAATCMLLGTPSNGHYYTTRVWW